MKRTKGIVLSIFLTLCLLLVTFGNAAAIPLPTESGSSLPTPTVSQYEKAIEVSLTTIPIASLPGTTSLSDGMLVPGGFPAGSKQFEGVGAQISGLSSGTALTCFPFTGANSGWGGQVALWTGTKWQLMPTSISTPVESTYSWGCAKISANGSYAFIKWITDNSKITSYPPSCGEMAYAYPYDLHYDDGWTMSTGEIYSAFEIPVGTVISFQILNVDPPGSFYSGTSGSGVVSLSQPDTPIPGIWQTLVTFDPEVVFIFDSESYTWRVFLPGCYTDFSSGDA